MKKIARRTTQVQRFATYRGITGTVRLLPGKGGYIFKSTAGELRLASFNDPMLVMGSRIDEAGILERVERDMVQELERVEADLAYGRPVITSYPDVGELDQIERGF